MFEDSITWTEAKAYCESLGGYLVAINNQAEQTFIESLVAKGQKNFYWIGGYCEADRVFRWVTGEPMTYTNWARGEPNNNQRREDKMSIYRLRNPRTTSSPFQWNDVANDGLIAGEAFFSAGNFGFICEWNDQRVTFNGHQYQLFEDSITWTEAKAYCESLGGYLVAINNQAEQTFIESLLSKGQKNFYWIGGYCEADRVFRWVTGEPMTYTNWARGEPNNNQRREDKMSIYRLRNPRTTSSPFQWNDVANDGLIAGEAFFSAGNFGFICEWNR